LDLLAKTAKGHQRYVSYNPTWDYFKNYVKTQLSSKIGSEVYAHRKLDVEPMFGRMKAIFGVRRIHLRGKKSVKNELGILLMTMNLTKLAKMISTGGLIGRLKYFSVGKLRKIQNKRIEILITLKTFHPFILAI